MDEGIKNIDNKILILMKNNYHIKFSTSMLSSFLIIKNLLSSFQCFFKVVMLPKKKKRFTLIRSPHVNKKSKEHFEIAKHQRLYQVNLTPQELQTFLFRVPNDLEIRVKKIGY
jgi:small subunit ribosomal protein S10